MNIFFRVFQLRPGICDFHCINGIKIIQLPSLSGSSNKTRLLTPSVSVFFFFSARIFYLVCWRNCSCRSSQKAGGQTWRWWWCQPPWRWKSSPNSLGTAQCWTFQGEVSLSRRFSATCWAPGMWAALPMSQRSGLVWFLCGFGVIFLRGEVTRMSCCVVFSASLQEIREESLVWWVLERIKWDFNFFFWFVCCLFQAVKVALDVHLNEPEGDILVFLTGKNFLGYSRWILALLIKQKSFQSQFDFSQSREKGKVQVDAQSPVKLLFSEHFRNNQIDSVLLIHGGRIILAVKSYISAGPGPWISFKENPWWEALWMPPKPPLINFLF